MKVAKTTKTSEILNHLKTNGSISSMEAINLYGATRLSAIIFEFRRKGMEIESKWEETKDRYGNNCKYVRYRLIED